MRKFKATQRDFMEYFNLSDGEKKLFRAVLKQMGCSWKDFYSDCIDYLNPEAGVPGFVYYSDTIPFGKKHLASIIDLILKRAPELMEQVKSFNEPLSSDEVLNFLSWCAVSIFASLVCTYKGV